jgi:hypothetical protein
MEVRSWGGDASHEITGHRNRSRGPEHKVKAQFLPVVEFTFRGLLPIWKEDTDADPQNPHTEYGTLKAVHNSHFPAGGIAIQSNKGNCPNRALSLIDPTMSVMVIYQQFEMTA